MMKTRKRYFFLSLFMNVIWFSKGMWLLLDLKFRYISQLFQFNFRQDEWCYRTNTVTICQGIFKLIEQIGFFCVLNVVALETSGNVLILTNHSQSAWCYTRTYTTNDIWELMLYFFLFSVGKIFYVLSVMKFYLCVVVWKDMTL